MLDEGLDSRLAVLERFDQLFVGSIFCTPRSLQSIGIFQQRFDLFGVLALVLSSVGPDLFESSLSKYLAMFVDGRQKRTFVVHAHRVAREGDQKFPPIRPSWNTRPNSLALPTLPFFTDAT